MSITLRVFIMGCGRVGAVVARALAEERHEVVIIDINPDSFRRLPDGLNIQAVVADGTREEDMRRAGVEKADVFLAVAQRDTANAMAAQMARHVFGVTKVVCRLNDPVRQEMYHTMGYEVVCPTRIIPEMLIQAIQR